MGSHSTDLDLRLVISICDNGFVILTLLSKQRALQEMPPAT